MGALLLARIERLSLAQKQTDMIDLVGRMFVVCPPASIGAGRWICMYIIHVGFFLEKRSLGCSACV